VGDVAVVGFAQAPNVRRSEATTNGVEMLVPIFQQLYADTGLSNREIGFWCSGSSDYLAGRAFSFISAIDAIGAFPPIAESHVEMDAAWALYEAWVKIRTGEVDTALVYGFGKSSAGNLRRTVALQLDPYTVAPLWPDSVDLAGLQARFGIDGGQWSERAMAEVTVRSRQVALGNPNAQLSGTVTVDDLLAAPYLADPLRAHDCAPITDGIRDRAGLRRTGNRAVRASRLDHRHRAPHRLPQLRCPRPHHVAFGGRGRAGREHRRGHRSRATRPVHPPRTAVTQSYRAWR